MVVCIDKEKCVGCRTCELACSFATKGYFNPEESNIRVAITDNGELDIHVRGNCKCSGEPTPLCAEFCPAKAIVVGF